MDLQVCGLIDIILIIGLILFISLGYKKGFIKKVISWVGLLVVLFVSFSYCGQFGDFLTEQDSTFQIYGNIYENINNNLVENLEGKQIAVDAPIQDVLHDALGIPRFIANMITNGLNTAEGTELTALKLANNVAEYLAGILMTIIAFFILAVGIFLIVFIFKLIANALRTNKIIRFIDGTLGAVLYATIFLAFVCVAFYLISIFMDKEWFSTAQDWLNIDMQLETEEFRLSKIVYNGNILRKILELFF